MSVSNGLGRFNSYARNAQLFTITPQTQAHLAIGGTSYSTTAPTILIYKNTVQTRRTIPVRLTWCQQNTAGSDIQLVIIKDQKDRYTTGGSNGTEIATGIDGLNFTGVNLNATNPHLPNHNFLFTRSGGTAITANAEGSNVGIYDQVIFSAAAGSIFEYEFEQEIELQASQSLAISLYAATTAPIGMFCMTVAEEE